MANRRNFVKQIGLLAGAFSAESLFNQAHAAEFEHQNLLKNGLSAKELATDEDYWSIIQQSYTTSPALINLNNGGVRLLRNLSLYTKGLRIICGAY